MRKLLVAAGLAAFAVAGSVAAFGANSFIGKEAPDFTAEDWIHGDGRTKLEDYRGEVVLLEFWFSH